MLGVTIETGKRKKFLAMEKNSETEELRFFIYL